MFVSFAIALYFEFGGADFSPVDLPSHVRLILGVGLTTVAWLAATYLTRPTDAAVLQNFYDKIRPGGPGWEPIAAQVSSNATTAHGNRLSLRIGAVFIGAITVYAVLFATGFYLYGNLPATLIAVLVALGGTAFLWRNRQRL